MICDLICDNLWAAVQPENDYIMSDTFCKRHSNQPQQEEFSMDELDEFKKELVLVTKRVGLHIEI